MYTPFRRSLFVFCFLFFSKEKRIRMADIQEDVAIDVGAEVSTQSALG